MKNQKTAQKSLLQNPVLAARVLDKKLQNKITGGLGGESDGDEYAGGDKNKEKAKVIIVIIQ